MVGSVWHTEWFTTGSRISLEDIQKLQMMLDQARKGLKQQPKDFYAVGFDTLVKRWDQWSIVGGGYIEKQNFFQVQILHFIYICDRFTESPSFISVNVLLCYISYVYLCLFGGLLVSLLVELFWLCVHWWWMFCVASFSLLRKGVGACCYQV
jgi:hypothetical protein